VNKPPLGAAPPVPAGPPGFAPNEKLLPADGDGPDPEAKPPPEAACIGGQGSMARFAAVMGWLLGIRWLLRGFFFFLDEP